MPIDPSIALGVKAPQFDSPVNALSQMLQVQGAQQQNQLGQAKLDEYQRGVGRQNLVYQTMQQLGAGATDDDRVNTLKSLGEFDLADKVQTGQLARQKTDADAKKALADALKTGTETLNIKLQHHRDQLGPVNDPEGAKAWVAAMYQDPDMAPIVKASGRSIEQQIASIPTDPKQFAQWKMQSSLGADKLVQYTTPDANNVATNVQLDRNNQRTTAASRYAADSTAKTAANRLSFDRTQAETSDDAKMDPLAVRMTAQQYLAGDTSALQNFGRGAQGAANLNAVRLEISKQATAAGMSGADIAAKVAEFGGLKAGQRTAGTRSASIEIAANEVAQLAPIALDASAKVSRSGLLPFGKAQIMFDQNTNDPAMRQFAMANTALVNAYGQAMARNGTATVADKDHAREMLSTAFDQQSYAAAVAQLQTETRAAQAAPKQVRKDLSDSIAGRDPSPAAPAGFNAAAIAAELKRRGH